ncbi:SGNH/GDSL hydrolase family protein [Robinsoniella peoriensis]|uniref:SGNH/GDSL hydrolase family protein n=1 Tax=Robinsoniella peoriensis TaxID=180332 RepID=UPI00085BECAD|nr:SGNH/GDSL hydrolase family protein [Robinsoniella peoriensis]
MKYKASDKNVKALGRTLVDKGVRWCALSGTGIGFTFRGTKCIVEFLGDDSTFGNTTEGQARVGIYVKEERKFDFILKERERQITIWESSMPEEVSVRVVKLSEAAMSTIGICGIEAETEDGIHPLPEKKHKIEFIGDSITCGFGVDREDPETPFETATEDVTKAYAYRTAQKLDADYSMVSYSGYGVVSGFTNTGEKQESLRVPGYYGRVGFSYGHPYGTMKIENYYWEFRKFRPDAIVINLGTNDDSYCQDYADRQQEYSEQYEQFLKNVRRYNPYAEIFCTVGVMGDRIYPALEAAVEDYKIRTEDEKVHVFPLTPQLPEDEFVSCYHPTAVTHEKAATQVAEEICSVMGVTFHG